MIHPTNGNLSENEENQDSEVPIFRQTQVYQLYSPKTLVIGLIIGVNGTKVRDYLGPQPVSSHPGAASLLRPRLPLLGCHEGKETGGDFFNWRPECDEHELIDVGTQKPPKP